MKKLLCILTATIMILSCGILTSAETDFPFGYYLDKVEYADDNLAEATIVFAGTLRSDVDIDCVGLLALYNGKTGEFIDVASVEYNFTDPFLEKQRFSVTQSIKMEDTTLEEYEFKFMVWDSVNSLKPEGYVNLGINTYVLTQNDLYKKDTYNIEGIIRELSLNSTRNNFNVNITKVDTLNKNQIFEIGTDITVNNDNNIDLGKYLGLSCNMEIYNDTTQDKYILNKININEYKNSQLTVDPILYFGSSAGKINYKEDADTSIVTTAKIEAPFKVYVNLTLEGTYATTTLAEARLNTNDINLAALAKAVTNSKEYKFVDTDNNGAYDTLFIEESASFIVDRTDADEQGIYAVTSTSAMNSAATSLLATENLYLPLDLNTEDERVSYVIKDTNGNALSFDDVKAGDVLTVKKSESYGFYYYDITVSSTKAVEGTISLVYTKKFTDSCAGSATVSYYTINGTAYRVNGAANAGSKLEAGTNGTFILTPDNRIIAYNIEKKEKFGVVIAMANNTSSFSSGVQVQAMTADGTIKIYDIADKLSINGGADITNATVTATDANSNGLKDIFVIGGVTVTSGTIVMFETNKDDEIRRMYTTQAAMRIKDDDVRVDTISAEKYNAVSGRIAGKYVVDDTTIIGVKNGVVDDKEKYSLASASALDEETSYNATAIYDASSKEITFMVITNLNIKPAYDSEAMVITSIATASVDGEERDYITGYIGNDELSYLVASPDKVDVYGLGANTSSSYTNGSSLKANEAVQFVLNANDEIIAVRKLVAYVGSDLCAVRIKTANADTDTDDADRNAQAEVVKLKDLSVVSGASVAEFYGFGVAGKVNVINGANIEFFKDAVFTYNSTSNKFEKGSDTDYTADELQVASNLYSSTFTGTAYFYGPGYNKVKTGSLASVKTFESLGKNMAKVNATSGKSTCEDIVYTYSYDGTNVLNYVYDPLNNSK